MKIKKGFILRKVYDEAIVVAIGDNIGFDGMIKLNETGAYLWDQMQEFFSHDTLKKALINKYNISEEEASHGAEDFLKILSDSGVIDYE